MSTISTIEWTDITWNPVVGCVKISPGCAHCYAELLAARLKAMALADIEAGRNPGRKRYYIDAIDDKGRWSGKLIPVPEALLDPFRWSKPRMVFVNSMSDLCHESVPAEFIAQVVNTMTQSPWHTYQILTKRSDRLRELLSCELGNAAQLRHIWWGVSVENRKHGLPRIAELQAAPAAVRFLSIEPLLEDLGKLDLRGIHWVIVGGESGHGARPMDEKWVLSIRDQCVAAGIPFFFKQWGGIHKSVAGRVLSGCTYDEMPALMNSPIPKRKQRTQLLEALAQ